jgi:hypothetical protein
MAYDQTSDPGYANLRVVLDHFPQLKEVAKTASFSEGEFDALPDTAFAWPGKRRYPLHTREHAALSLGYRKLASERVPAEVDGMLKQAADAYELEDAIYAKIEIEKTASAPEDYVFPEKKRFLVKTAEDVKLAEQRMYECYRQMSIEDRAEGMFRLCKLAEAHQVSLSPSTLKLAGFTLTSTRKLKDWIEARKEATWGSVFSSAYSKIAESLNGVAPEFNDREVQVKLAQAIHVLDKESGLTKLYGRKLLDPIQTVFNSDKLAAETVEVGTGMFLKKSNVTALPLSFWQDLLGDDITQEISSDGQTVDPESLMALLPTLPSDLKAVVQKQLAAYQGV